MYVCLCVYIYIYIHINTRSSIYKYKVFPVAQTVKNLPTLQEIQSQSLDLEDPLEKGKVTHSSILAWRTTWTEEPGGLQSTGSQGVRHDWATNTFTFK